MKPIPIILMALLPVLAAPGGELEDLRAENRSLKKTVAEQQAEIAKLQARLAPTNQPAQAVHAEAKPILKPFSEIPLSHEEGTAFQGTYIRLFSSRANNTEAENLKFLFKKNGSKVVQEDRFDPFSEDGKTRQYAIEIRYETADPRCLKTCGLIQHILQQRYGIEVPIIHDSQYTYKGDRHYVEVYICEKLSDQKYEFKGQKLPLRFW